MPNQDGSLSAEEALGLLDQPEDTGGTPDGPLTPEQALALQSGQPQADPVKQATSASASAAADNSWFSPEFRSGALFKEVLGPVGTAAKALYDALPNEEEARKRLSVGTGAPIPQSFEQSPYGQVPPHIRQALSETLDTKLYPKEATPLYWMGRYNQLLARVLNPQGPPVARAIRTGLEATGGFEEKGGEAVAGMVTPFNALLAVAPEALPARLASLANKGLALYFLKQALGATPQQIQRFNASKDTAEKAGIVAETLVSYAPVAAFHGRGRALRADARKSAEEQTAQQDTGEAPVHPEGITSDQFKTWAQTRLDELTQSEQELTPAEAAEAKDLQEGLKEGGDVNAMATKFQVELSDVTPPAEGEAKPAAEPAAAPAAEQAPAPEQAADAGTARFRGKNLELMNKAAFIRALRSHRETLNAKDSLTSEDIADITEIDSALQAADQGQLTRIDELAREKYGVELTDEGGEPSAEQPGNAQVQTPPAAPGEQEGVTGGQPPAGDSDNVVRETQGEEAGGAVPSETGTEPVVTEPGTDTGRNKNMPDWLREEMQRRGMAPGRILNDIDLQNPSIIAAIDNDPTLSVSQKEHLKATGEFLPPEEAAKAQTAKSRGPKLPANLEDALAGAENSAIEGDKRGVAENIKEATRLLARSKGLSKDGRKAALNRIAMVEHTLKGKLPPKTTAESDPNVVVYDGKTYHRTGEHEGTGIWKLNGRRKVGSSALNVALDNVWEARKAITEEKAASGKKAAPKTKSTAATVPTTAPEVSREEIGTGEAQPVPKVGEMLDHPNGKKVQVIPNDASTPEGQIRIRFPNGAEANIDPAAFKLKPKAPEPVKPDPGADLRKEIEDLQDKIIQDKTDATKLKGKERLAANRAIKKDQLALLKLKNKAGTLPKPAPDTSAKTERDITERGIFRKSLQDRVKKEKFDKTTIVRPSSTGGEADVLPASRYRGLQIHKEKANIKPWRVTHEGSGELIGHFDTEADAKAFAVRIHEGTKYDFTRPWDQVKKQIKGEGSAAFDEMRNDPYAFLPDAAARLREKLDKDNTQGGFMMNDDIGPQIMEFGRRLYQRGTQFRDWAINMTKHLGQKIIGSLRSIWDSITGRNLLPGRGERGGASPGGGSLKKQPGQLRKDFLTRAEANAFIKANKPGWQSHSVIEQPGTTMPVQLLYRPKPAPGSGAAQGKPIVTASGAIIQPKYNPAAANPPAKVNAGTGGTIKPPPPGSALGPTPPRSNPHQVWYQRILADWKKAWEWYHPGAYASTRLEPATVAVNTHQRWIAGPANGIWNSLKSPWYLKLQKLTDTQFIDAEHDARTKYQANRALGQGELQATLNAIKGNPLRDYFIHRMDEMVKEKAASKRLDMKMPGFIDGPYAPRLTEMLNKSLIRIGGSREGVVTQLRRSLGHFDKSRVYESMKEGIDNGVQYRNHLEAIIQRERVGEQLKATAQALDDLEKGGVIYAKKSDALAYAKATYKPKDVDVIKMEGFGGKDWWIRNRQDARVIDQNLNNAGPGSQWQTFTQIINNYARNPNLWNPAPHVTKNMFFKYALARINNLSLKGDTPEFKRMTQAEKIDLFHQHFTMPGDQPGRIKLAHSERIPEMIAGESKRWFDKITRRGLLLNRPSQKFIFEKADPYLRYKLWESYFRKGMHPQEAANNVLFDLIRYDENSGGLNIMKSIPFNFFSTWRTGTYVTIYKAMRTHPIRTLMFFGAVEYLREMIYRHSGQWTHLPIDYMANPMAETVESTIKAKREIAMGRNPFKAGLGVAENTAAILLTTAAFGPGGSQAPTTIKDAMGALQGDQVAFTRMTNMFWGLSQLFNIPQEYMAYTRDKKPEHLVNILTGAALGTHSAISYEPRRLGKYIPEWMPGMAYTPELKRMAALREKAEGIAIKAATTHERRFGMFRWATTGSKEDQIEQVLRRAGVIKTRQQGAPPPVSPRRGGGY